ncbi:MULTISPECIES: hypothetical protein [Metabacillus]|uniref:hypothetical protein n=1 Tax=Metabacillus TaxID=2675233 RepID=UPI000C7FAD43|nr:MULTISPECIES: hypothetical protein [Metabacillus]MCM3443977.1 hypothetical protein [Metabacillus halosaccharovorans]PMC34968.1 hypothetical protein CJ195_20900 [Bacillus sp. UMB0899]
MEIPKYIQDSLEKSSKAFEKARKHEKIVRDWLVDKGFENDESVNDSWIDNIEYGHGLHKNFIEFLKHHSS